MEKTVTLTETQIELIKEAIHLLFEETSSDMLHFKDAVERYEGRSIAHAIKDSYNRTADKATMLTNLHAKLILL